jgi:predicted heme/steroid binding protein
MSENSLSNTITNICEQRKRLIDFAVPPTRYTPVSPYNGTFTKFQLDMRRKAEILKYSNVTSSTKTNNLTKSEKYNQLINGRLQTKSYIPTSIVTIDANGNYNKVTVNYPDKLIVRLVAQKENGSVNIVGKTGYFKYEIIPNGQIVNCAADDLIPTPTSSCNVPGPIMNLIDDENIPLYNFTNTTINNAAYSENITINDINMWKINSLNNIAINASTSKIGSFLITNLIKESSYFYTLRVPIGIYINDPTGLENFYLTINNISLIVYYNNNVVVLDSVPVVSFSRYSFNSPIKINYYRLNTGINGYNYYGYIDTINIANLLLQTTPYNIYDFYMNITLSTSSSSTFNNYVVVANPKNINLNELSISTSRLMPPTSLVLSSITNETAVITFSAPITSTPILNYSYFILPTPVNFSSGIASATSNSIIVAGLTMDTVYKLNVIANYSNGSSASLEAITGATINYNPSNFSVSSVSETSITITFTKGGNPNISTYYVIASSVNNSYHSQYTTAQNPIDSPIDEPITINGLYSGTKYYLQLYQSFRDNTISITTNNLYGSTLSPLPTNLSISDISYTNLKLNYTQPIGTGPIGYYIISSSVNFPDTILDLSNNPSPTSPITIPKLNSGVSYNIYMKAIYNKTLDELNAITPYINAITSYDAPINLIPINVTELSFYIGYEQKGTLPNQYIINVTDPSDNTIIKYINDTTINPILITDLSTGLPYNVTMTAVYPIANKTSIPLTVSTTGQSTTGLIVLNITVNSFDITFNRTGNPDGHFVTAIPSNSSKPTVIFPQSPTLITSNYITVTGLLSGTIYTVTVTTVFASEYKISNSLSVNTLANSPVITNVTATENSIIISYNAPLGTLPNRYNASATLKNTNIIYSLVNVSQNPIIISNLSSGAIYDISLSAVYDTGSYNSIYPNVQTLSSPSTITGINTNLITDPSTNAITVYISPPLSGTLPSSYSLIANPRTRNNGQDIITKSNITPISIPMSVIVNGLITGTIYDISLVSVYGAGTQTSTSTISGSTIAYPPRINSVTNATINTLTVNFLRPLYGDLPINYSAIANPRSILLNQQPITITGIAKTTNTIIFTGLTSATVYDISMVAVYDAINSINIDTWRGTTLSNPPQNIRITNITDSIITVSYDPPISTPTGYYGIAVPKTTYSGQSNITTDTTTNRTITFNNLYAGTSYNIFIVALYTTGNQQSSVDLSGSTLFNSPSITALNRNFTDASTNSITVYFSQPSGIIPYNLPNYYNFSATPQYTQSTFNQQEIKYVTGVTRSSTSYIITNLISGTNYDISMAAVYSVGNAVSNTLIGSTLFNAPSI